MSLIYINPYAFAAAGAGFVVGDTGPGGGIVFLINTGLYYEAAPLTWAGASDPSRTWSSVGNRTSAVSGADGRAIGTGKQNTTDIINQSGNIASTCAAVLARDYTGGGLTDWFLPSMDELLEMHAQRTTINLPTPGPIYWSSTELNATTAGVLWDNGAEFTQVKGATARVRPIRSGLN